MMMNQDQINSEKFYVIGANHRSSTMLLRDRLYMSEPQLVIFNGRLIDAGFEEAMVLSTTDRTEILVAPGDVRDPGGEVIQLLAAHAGVSRSEIEGETYILTNGEAVKHVFAMTAALDSLVIGDLRLVEQIKSAHRLAIKLDTSGPILTDLMVTAFNVCTQVYRQTEIGRRPVSIASAAVQVARDLHGDLARCSGLLIGAGEMGEMLASSLLSAGLEHLVATHPVEVRADAIANQLNCHVGSFDGLAQLLIKADIVLTSMNTRRFVLEAEMVVAATRARRRKPIFLIDTGVPGDIDPSVETADDAFLYTLDDLERVTREGRETREAEAEAAWKIVTEAAAGYSPLAIAAATGANDGFVDGFEDGLEAARQDALRESGGDADKATRLLMDRLLKLRSKD